MRTYIYYLITICTINLVQAQDTFSIVALDSVTGEVGSAGASCVNLIFLPAYDTDFLGELFPGVGAINTQAYYLPENQENAATRMELGDSPEEIIDWLIANDAEGTPEFRQYGIVAFVDGAPASAAHTGSSTDDYKGHRTGRHYSIQGNILLGPEILDSMEYNFIHTEGDLACKLMAAMQGANVVGADTRCEPYGTSSLFAFLKVAQPEDDADAPSLLLAVETGPSAGVEPIDSLQSLFNAVHTCETTGWYEDKTTLPYQIFPNPVSNELIVKTTLEAASSWTITNLFGQIILHGHMMQAQAVIPIHTLDPGMYYWCMGEAAYAFIKTE
jgi:uncharacterized Ntn-hydrolase superfamily protein